MADKIKAIRGMNDVLPDDSYKWLRLESIFAKCLQEYGYKQIRFPLLESTNLFKRTIGEVTDIVAKEMYTFNDLNDESISLRPEGTASCVRACLENGLLHNQQQKLWYLGPMFRHERPQKGRYRQFNQLGVEVFGVPGVGVELELILLCKRLWSELGVAEHLKLQINTLGDLDDRQNYRQSLVAYFQDNFSKLDNDSKTRLDKNPLRILDSKNPDMQDLIANAPKLVDSLKPESKEIFAELCSSLESLGVEYAINPCLVRGLDYYGHVVFEWVTDKLGSQATVCAGGRFDKLVEQLGGNETKAIGFALGVERLLLLMDSYTEAESEQAADIYIIADTKDSLVKALGVAESIRKPCNLRVMVNLGLEKFKSQFKKADRSGAHIALILGADELQQDTISIKYMREDKPQTTINLVDLDESLSLIFAGE